MQNSKTWATGGDQHVWGTPYNTLKYMLMRNMIKKKHGKFGVPKFETTSTTQNHASPGTLAGGQGAKMGHHAGLRTLK
jgi:hypothetical protein